MPIAILSKKTEGNYTMKFMASLHKVQVDNEGESTVILKVPQTELPAILELTQLTQTLLEVEVESNDDKLSRTGEAS